MTARKSQLHKGRLIELMAYADGELDPHELAALEDELASSPESVEVVESFRAMGDRMRRDHAGTPDLADGIMARIAADKPALAEGAKVLDLQAVRAKKLKIGAAVASALAMAAAVALYLGHAGDGVAPHMAAAAMGVEVQQVDQSAKVFSIPALHSNASSVVVWLGDEDEATAEPKLPDAAPQPSTRASAQ